MLFDREIKALLSISNDNITFEAQGIEQNKQFSGGWFCSSGGNLD